jgi:hypothetical protein
MTLRLRCVWTFGLAGLLAGPAAWAQQGLSFTPERLAALQACHQNRQMWNGSACVNPCPANFVMTVASQTQGVPPAAPVLGAALFDEGLNCQAKTMFLSNGRCLPFACTNPTGCDERLLWTRQDCPTGQIGGIYTSFYARFCQDMPNPDAPPRPGPTDNRCVTP